MTWGRRDSEGGRTANKRTELSHLSDTTFNNRRSKNGGLEVSELDSAASTQEREPPAQGDCGRPALDLRVLLATLAKTLLTRCDNLLNDKPNVAFR